MRDRRRPTVPLNVMLSYDIMGIQRPYLVLSTDNKGASPTASEASGPNCMDIVDTDGETGTEIEGELLGASTWAVAGV